MSRRNLMLMAVPDTTVAPAIMVAEFDPTSDANLLLSGASIQSATDMTGNNRNATASGVSGPDREVAGVNSESVFNFVGASNDALTISNALSAFNGVHAIGIDGMVQIAAFSAAYNILKTYVSVGTGNRFTVQTVATSGKLLVATRRIATDAQVSTTSTIALTAGVQSYVSVQVDYVLGMVRFQIDDAVEYVPINGARSWTSGLGITENVNSSTAPVFGRVAGGAVLNGKIGYFGIWTGLLTEAQFVTRRATVQATFATPQKVLEIVEPASDSLLLNKVYPSIGGFADGIPVTVNVTVGPDVDVTYRLLNQLDGSEGVSTTALGTTVGGTLSTVIDNVPEGPWYIEVRASGQPDYEAVLGTNRIGVGIVGAHTGLSSERIPGANDGRYSPYASPAWPITTTQNQSGPVAIHQRFTRQGYYCPTRGLITTSNNTGTGEPNTANTPLHFGAGGNGLTVFCMELSQLAGGIPISPVWVPIGGTPLTIWEPGGAGYEYLNTSITQTNGPQWTDLQYISWNGGQVEAIAGTSKATFKATLESVIANYRTVTSNANLPIGIAILAPIGTSRVSDEWADNIRQAMLEVIDADSDVFIYCNTLDLILGSDNLHLQDDQWVIQMTRAAWNIGYYACGRGTHGAAGPNISGGSAVVGTRQARFSVTHDGGTTLKDSSGSTTGTGLTQFGESGQINGVSYPATFSLDAGEIVMDFDASAPVFVGGDIVGIRHQYGANPDITNCVLDDTVNSVVLQPTRGWFTVTAA